jgi:hypothetical protein
MAAVLFIKRASLFNELTVFPLIHSVARELEAMAEPQPKVLNLASIIFPSLSTSIWKKTQKSLFWCYAFLPTSQFTERKMGQVNHTWLGRQKKY